MKWNCYDLFDHYDAEKNGMPEIAVQPIATNTIMEQVFAKTGTVSAEKRRNRFRLTKLTAVLTAAVVLVTGGTMITAAAGLGGMDKFFQSLFVTETPESPEKMGDLVTMPGASFDSTNPDVQFSLLGMYGDGSQVMLSFEVRAANGVELSDDLLSVVDMTATGADGVSKPLVYSGSWYNLKASETEENVYHMNLFLRDSDLQGKTLDLTFQNFYTSQQIQAVHDEVCAFDTEQRNQYIRETLGEDALEGLEEDTLPDTFDLDAWKSYRREHNFDQLISDKYSELYNASDRAVDGMWHTSIVLDFAVDEPITAEYIYGDVKLQTLSAQFSYPTKMDEVDQNVEFVLVLKDGRKVATDPYMLEGALTESVTNTFTLPDGYVETTEQYAEWNADHTIETIVICYSEPIAPQDIAEVKMIQYVFDADAENAVGGWTVTNEETIYTAQ